MSEIQILDEDTYKEYIKNLCKKIILTNDDLNTLNEEQQINNHKIENDKLKKLICDDIFTFYKNYQCCVASKELVQIGLVLIKEIKRLYSLIIDSTSPRQCLLLNKLIINYNKHIVQLREEFILLTQLDDSIINLLKKNDLDLDETMITIQKSLKAEEYNDTRINIVTKLSISHIVKEEIICFLYKITDGLYDTTQNRDIIIEVTVKSISVKNLSKYRKTLYNLISIYYSQITKIEIDRTNETSAETIYEMNYKLIILYQVSMLNIHESLKFFELSSEENYLLKDSFDCIKQIHFQSCSINPLIIKAKTQGCINIDDHTQLIEYINHFRKLNHLLLSFFIELTESDLMIVNPSELILLKQDIKSITLLLETKSLIDSITISSTKLTETFEIAKLIKLVELKKDNSLVNFSIALNKVLSSKLDRIIFNGSRFLSVPNDEEVIKIMLDENSDYRLL